MFHARPRCGTRGTVDESEIENADNLEDALDEEGRNVTQQRMDAEGVEDVPVDLDWDDSGETDIP
jgi:hypothetical protein